MMAMWMDGPLIYMQGICVLDTNILCTAHCVDYIYYFGEEKSPSLKKIGCGEKLGVDGGSFPLCTAAVGELVV
jgi:hypothetical protein